MFHWSLITFLSLTTGLVGCESLQRKLTRKPKHPTPPPSPIISFQDYTRAMTPLDRYRKHWVLFGYWNGELLQELQGASLNPKRLKRASAESLDELRALHGWLQEEPAAWLWPLIEERVTIDRQFQRGAVTSAHANIAWRMLEAQTRRINREFSWRDVEDRLKQ